MEKKFKNISPQRGEFDEIEINSGALFVFELISLEI